MIRVAAIAGGFLFVTMTLILVQQGNQPRPKVALDQKAPDKINTVKHEGAQSSNNSPSIGGTKDVSPSVKTQPVAKAPTNPQGDLESLKSLAEAFNETDLETLIAGAMQQGQSADYIAALIKNTLQRGGKSPAPQLVHDGSIDISALIETLAAPTPSAQSLAGPIAYKVQAGDTLEAIAYRFYGNIGQSEYIIRANPDSFSTGAKLAIGQRLVIPAL